MCRSPFLPTMAGNGTVAVPYKQKSRTLSYADKRKRTSIRMSFIVLALPIFTARHQATIVGVSELNFCVRDGNRWTLTTINTNSHREGFALPLYKAH